MHPRHAAFVVLSLLSPSLAFGDELAGLFERLEEEYPGSNEGWTVAAISLRDYLVVGTATSIPFFLALFEDEDFMSGVYDTGFITPEWLSDCLEPPEEVVDTAIVASAIARFEADLALSSATPSASEASSAWKRAHRWKTYRRLS